MSENKMNEEMLSEEQLNAYLQVMDDIDVDLWDRIEEGFEKELIENPVHEQKKRTTNFTLWKKWGIAIAAAVLLVVIAVPVFFRNQSAKSETNQMLADDMAYEKSENEDIVAATEACEEQAEWFEECDTDDIMSNESSMDDMEDAVNNLWFYIRKLDESISIDGVEYEYELVSDGQQIYYGEEQIKLLGQEKIYGIPESLLTGYMDFQSDEEVRLRIVITNLVYVEEGIYIAEFDTIYEE